MTDRTRPRYPLHVTISALFIALIVLLGVVLSWQSYSKTSDIIFSSADQVYDQIARELVLDFNATYNPVADTLQLLALSPVASASTLAERLNSLDMIHAALMSEESVAAIQLGYPNGDYFIVRSLATEYMRSQFSAPADARFMADHISTDGNGERRLARLFFDHDMHELQRQPPEVSDYDPRLRPWYTGATDTPSATAPYLFYFIGKVGATITRTAGDAGAVIAADVTLDQLSGTISRHRITAGSEVVLITANGEVLAYADTDKLVRKSDAEGVRMAGLHELGSEVLASLAGKLDLDKSRLDYEFAGRRWKGALQKIARAGGVDLYALMVSPVDELLSEAVRIRWAAVMTTGLIILLAIPVVWVVARRIANPLRQLAGEASLISQFDFDTPVQTRSFIKEVDELAGAMGMMKTTIKRFLVLINSLSGERNFKSLLTRVTSETLSVSQASGVLTWLVDENDEYLVPGMLQTSEQGDCPVGKLPRFAMQGDSGLVAAAKGEGFAVMRLEAGREDGLGALLACFSAQSLLVIAMPLHNRQHEIIGVLCLVYTDSADQEEQPYGDGQIAFVRALSGFAAVTLESRQLLMMQEALLDSFIKLIAGAIDSKSPYTGGHCQRVPAITRMLAQAACDSNEPPFSSFDLNEKEWEAVDIASWLHDCGKVTTPEYVVDKSTKLETIYDRIHEIRMRFEVLKRDAEIRFWEDVANGGERDALQAVLDSELASLDADFSFIAECNEGGEFMAPERIERLREIGERTWKRTLDDRIGISWEEAERKNRTPASGLPVEERLLDDKPEHLIERGEADTMPADNPWGFRLDVPEHKYNRGELYNLSVARGTLSNEERYKINDHIMQTIIMLEKLPYPRHLRDVPMIAGCHHETMDGKGYPKRLTADEMPLTARIMAIADIFEALTASDRPYKKAKTLSEAIRILGFMKKDSHIDPDLFRLFLSSGVYLDYAREYLDPEQIDAVDISEYL
jgi:HD-GYP domain-containing protein (c-di-GMP phosphodiesterase class II)/HAMP domain-containing protein